MEIGIYGGTHEKQFIELCESLRIIETDSERFLKNGFTNYHKPDLYYCKRIKQKDNYPVTLNITIDKKTMTFKSIDILDENFLQPHPCNQKDFEQALQYINELKNKKLLVKEEKQTNSSENYSDHL